MKHTFWLTLTVSLLLTNGCPSHEEQADQSTQQAARGDLIDRFDDGYDALGSALASDMPDEADFALYFITRFGLTGYEEEIAQLASDNSIACVTLAAVYGNNTPSIARLQSAGLDDAKVREAIDGLIGAVFGLRCTANLNADFWIGLGDAVTPSSRSALVWGMAQLDLEAGGPLGLNNDEKFEFLRAIGLDRKGDTLEFQTGIDAVVGDTDYNTIPWDRYIQDAEFLDFSAIQWAALLRWAQKPTWQKMLADKSLSGDEHAELFRASLLLKRTDIEFPTNEIWWQALDVADEREAYRYIRGEAESIAVPDYMQFAVPEGAEASSFEIDWDSLSSTLDQLGLALQCGDTSSLEDAIDAVPNISETAQSGVLSVIERYNPDAITDEQIGQLVDLKDRSIAYWLVFGWPQREPVLNSEITTLLRLTPGQEYAMLAQAYALWKDDI